MSLTTNGLTKFSHDAVHTYRHPPDAPLDAIWARVEAEAFSAPRIQRAPSWRVFAGAIAATLVFGVVIGRVSAGRRTFRAARDNRNQDARTARIQHGGRSVSAHDAGIPRSHGRAARGAAVPRSCRDERRTARRAGAQLLGTTRLLLDSPVAQEQRMKDLLQDLELVLAQVARLQSQRPGEASP